MSKTLALVSCVSKKNNIECPAQFLYKSSWFIKAARYAEWIADEWYILSAKYGLVQPEQIIGPYNLTLNTMKKKARILWAAGVMQALEGRLLSGDTVVFLAGETYRKYLIDPIGRTGCRIEIPTKNKRIGEQMQWLDEQFMEVTDGTPE